MLAVDGCHPQIPETSALLAILHVMTMSCWVHSHDLHRKFGPRMNIGLQDHGTTPCKDISCSSDSDVPHSSLMHVKFIVPLPKALHILSTRYIKPGLKSSACT